MTPRSTELDTMQLRDRFAALRQYIGWTSADAQRVRAVAPLVSPHLTRYIDDFYREVKRHPETRQRITGGNEQVERLKETLRDWFKELFAANFDDDYVVRRWAVGWRHVQIGLRQVYVNAAMSRLRSAVLSTIWQEFTGSETERIATSLAIGRAMDLDLAIIQDAYEAEKHLRSEAAFRSLVESADCAIFILREDHSVAYLNPFAQQITGFSLADTTGKDFVETLIPEKDRASFLLELENVIRDESPLGSPISILTRQATTRRLMWNVRLLEDFAGAPALLGVGHDITELQQAQERALQAERLAAIGQTMAGLAHESRNAFQRIQACLEMLQLEVEDRPEAMELVERVQRAQNHLHQLNEEVRSYAAPIRLELQNCDLGSLWREAWHNLELARRDKKITFRELNPDVEDVCQIDPFALGQVFRNILENAIVACPEEGRIEVRLKATELASGRDAVEVSFRDNGPGLSAEARESIFEPFFTTRTKGTGLGMAIAKRIVDAHGGKIVADSHEDGGAQISIVLPAAVP